MSKWLMKKVRSGRYIVYHPNQPTIESKFFESREEALETKNKLNKEQSADKEGNKK